jgi:transposase
MTGLFWLSDAQWAVMEPFMPRNQPGARRVDDRRTISGMVHVIRTGCRWQDCPGDYGPATTVYNRFNRWSRRGFWRGMLTALAEAGWATDSASLDATYVKAHRSAHGGKGGLARRASGPRGAGRPPRSTSSRTSSAAQPSSTSRPATPAT